MLGGTYWGQAIERAHRTRVAHAAPAPPYEFTPA
jgi:hypothetical protein